MEKNYIVYKHTTPDGKVYIGMTGKTPEERWKNGGGYYKNEFAEAIRRFGWTNIKHDILSDGLTHEEACKEEQRQIVFYKSTNPLYGYNKSTGGKFPFAGCKHSEQWKKTILESRKRKYDSEKTGERISAAKKGKPNGLTGRTGEKCRKAGMVYQIEENTGIIVRVFYGFDEAHRITGYAKTPLKEAATGKRKRAYGYIWKYERGRNNVII